MGDFLKNFLSSSNAVSFKRVLGSIGFISLVVFLFICTDAHKSDAIAAVEYLTISIIFGTVIEKFSPNKDNQSPN